jgi:hypothetical protein
MPDAILVVETERKRHFEVPVGGLGETDVPERRTEAPEKGNCPHGRGLKVNVDRFGWPQEVDGQGNQVGIARFGVGSPLEQSMYEHADGAIGGRPMTGGINGSRTGSVSVSGAG